MEVSRYRNTDAVKSVNKGANPGSCQDWVLEAGSRIRAPVIEAARADSTGAARSDCMPSSSIC